MALSAAMQWALANGMSEADVYKNINDFLATNPDAATTQAQMAQYGISPQDVAAATGGKSGGMLSGNIMAGASWNSTNTALQDSLTQATGQQTSNYAVGGSTTADTLNQLNTFLAGGGQFDPNATVYLQAGGVDFITGVDKGVVKDNLNQIVKTLGDQGVNVVLTGSPYAKSVEDVINNNFDPKVDQIYNDVAKANSNVALVGTQGEILQNKKLLVDALHTNAEGTAIYNQSVIDALSQFKNEVPSSTPQAIAQVQKTNTVATTPPVITQAAASPVVAQTLATETVDSLIKAGNLNPTQIAAATGVPVGEIVTKAAALAPFQGSTKLGDTYVSPNYSYTQSGEETIVGGLESIGTSKVSSEQGSRTELYSPTGELTNVGKYDKGPSFFGGLADAFNDPVVQAAFLGLGGGGAIGNALGLTGSTAQAVGTGLLKGGAAAAGGADIGDALKAGLLSGGLVYGAGALDNYLATGSIADPGITERQLAIADAKQLADQGLSQSQIADVLGSSGYNEVMVDSAIKAATKGLTPATLPTSTATDVVNVTGTAAPAISTGGLLSSLVPTSTTTPTVTNAGTVNVTGSSTPQQVDQAVLNLVNSQLASNVKTPANLANVQVTGTADKGMMSNNDTASAILNTIAGLPTTSATTPTNNLANVEVTGQKPTTTQELASAITAAVPSVTPTQAAAIAEQVITSGKPVTNQEVISAITAALPTVTAPATVTTQPVVPEQTITAQKPTTINDVVTAAAIPLIQPSTPLEVTPVTSNKTNELGLTDAQMLNLLKGGIGLLGGLGGAALAGAGSSSGGIGALPTQQPPMYTGDYFTKVQQNYNQLLPAVPRDVASPLRDWYLSQYGA